MKLDVEVHGKRLIRHCFNGEEVISYGQPQLGGNAHAEALAAAANDKMLSEGYFCLQSESHPVEFRKIEIQEIQP